MKDRLSNIIIAIALVAIALNLTYTNIVNSKPAEESPGVQEEIVQVIGRVTEVFDGLGAESGFLVTNGKELRFVRYDQGSMAAQKGWEPQYIKLVKFGDGETVLDPITVEPFR